MREVVYRFADGSETKSYQLALDNGNKFETVVREVEEEREVDPVIARLNAKRWPHLV